MLMLLELVVPISSTLRLPNSKVGLVIGKQGATVKTIQNKHRCQLVIPEAPDADNNLYRTITINAHSQEDIDAAKQEILFTITPPGLQGNPAAILTEDLAEAQHCIPNDKVGLVIGKQGATIKLIQGATGCRIQIPSDPDPNSNPPTRTLLISGNRAQVEQAIVEIDKYVYGRGPMDSAYGSQAGWDYSQADSWSAQWQQYYAAMGQWQGQQVTEGESGGVPGATSNFSAMGADGQAAMPGQEQKYTREQWEQWKQYYKQYGYEMADECPEHLRAEPFE